MNKDDEIKTICPICGVSIKEKYLSNHSLIHSSEILSYLYLGSFGNAANEKELNNRKIKCIINCATECQNCFPEQFNYLKIEGVDDNFPIKSYFSKTNNYIKTAKAEGKNVLVHCFAGVSRSTSIVVAYLMKEMGYSFKEAYEFVRKRRPQVNINSFFVKQLVEYEKELKYK